MLGLVFKTSVRHFVSQVGSTPTSFRHSKARTINTLLVPLISMYHPVYHGPMSLTTKQQTESHREIHKRLEQVRAIRANSGRSIPTADEDRLLGAEMALTFALGQKSSLPDWILDSAKKISDQHLSCGCGACQILRKEKHS